eukprot:1737796-Alexandrium_andersonii.AAC.1
MNGSNTPWASRGHPCPYEAAGSYVTSSSIVRPLRQTWSIVVVSPAMPRALHAQTAGSSVARGLRWRGVGASRTAPLMRSPRSCSSRSGRGC